MANYSSLELDFSEWLKTTANGTLLKRRTVQYLTMDLDLFCFQQRTGVIAMADTQSVSRFPWKKVFNALEIDPRNPDKQKILDFLDTQIDEFVKNRKSSSSGNTSATVDPEFAKSAPSHLHAILKSAQNSIDLNTLAGYFAMKTETAPTKSNTDHIREQIRLLAKKFPETFVVSGKGIAKVYRLKDSKGKETGVEMDEPKVGASSVIPMKRLTSRTKNAMSAVGVVPDQANFRKLQVWCENENITRLTEEHMQEFAESIK